MEHPGSALETLVRPHEQTSPCFVGPEAGLRTERPFRN